MFEIPHGNILMATALYDVWAETEDAVDLYPDNTSQEEFEAAQEARDKIKEFVSDWTGVKSDTDVTDWLITQRNNNVSFIADGYMTEYIKDQFSQNAEGVDFSEWPYSYIDWGRAAEEERGNYTSCDLDGVYYYTDQIQ
jgi:hypothetical protein